jgi:hypothetical protein
MAKHAKQATAISAAPTGCEVLARRPRPPALPRPRLASTAAITACRLMRFAGFVASVPEPKRANTPAPWGPPPWACPLSTLAGERCVRARAPARVRGGGQGQLRRTKPQQTFATAHQMSLGPGVGLHPAKNPAKVCACHGYGGATWRRMHGPPADMPSAPLVAQRIPRPRWEAAGSPEKCCSGFVVPPLQTWGRLW